MSSRPSTENTNFCGVGPKRQIPAEAAHGCSETSRWIFRASADACWTITMDSVPRGATWWPLLPHLPPCHSEGPECVTRMQWATAGQSIAGENGGVTIREPPYRDPADLTVTSC